MGSPGKRLLVATIDEIAKTQPERPWISVPRDDNDLSIGFRDITFKQFANAINHATAWLDSTLGPIGSAFETFAYEGPPDARLPIIAVAAVKTGRKILFPFPLAPPPVKGSLMDQTKCSDFVYAETSHISAKSILADRPHVKGHIAPLLQEWITDTEAEPREFKKSWEDAKDDPWMIFHTSGTTGFPKPIINTNKMMTTYDAASTFPDAGLQTQASCHVNRRVYSTIPMNHLVGMVGALQGTVWMNTTVIIGPSTKPPNPILTTQVLQYGNVDGFVAPPLLIKALCRDPNALQLLRNTNFIQWAGAPLEQAIGDLLQEFTRLSPAFGTTEAGPYLTLLCDNPKDWAYYRFRDGQGIHFIPQANNLFELVFKKEQNARWQQIFLLHPELEEYHTKDLFQRHPTKDGLWLYSGRADDMVVLENGDGFQASFVEDIAAKDPNIHAVLVGGSGRARPFLLVELEDGQNNTQDAYALITKFWPTIETANASCADFVKILRELTILAQNEKPFIRSGKGTILRRETFELYQGEIEGAYKALKSEK
ncbi:putative AMP-binding enzyme [Tricladium varicosporioides]|nr:putative AMP-binding enzyme [Hymenoscyphus varicosporioides]